MAVQMALTNAASTMPVSPAQLRGLLEAYFVLLVCLFNRATSLLVRTFESELMGPNLARICQILEQKPSDEQPLLCITIVMFIFSVANTEIQVRLQAP